MKASDELLLKRIGGYSLLGKTLGKGAFARVELANHSLSNTKVALKLIDLEKVQNSYIRKNVLREATILKNLRHENIVRLYETLSYHNTYCFVTEYLAGGNLLAHLQSQKGEKKLTEKQARKCFTQILSAVQYLHGKGIIHRDLKMQNIMLTEDKKTLKLIDFGLSNYFDKENLLKTPCGSAEYAAPELFDKGTNYGPTVEIWSLGVILFGMTTGKMPFLTKGCEKKENFVVQVRRGLNISHEHLLLKISADLKRLLLLMLEPDKEKRITLNGVITNTWVTENGKYPLLPSAPVIITHSTREKILERVADLYSQPIDLTVKHIHSKQHSSMDATFQLLLDKALNFHKTKTQRRSISAPNKISQQKYNTSKRPFTARPDGRNRSIMNNMKNEKFSIKKMNNLLKGNYNNEFESLENVESNDGMNSPEDAHCFTKCLQISKTTFTATDKSRSSSPNQAFRRAKNLRDESFCYSKGPPSTPHRLLSGKNNDFHQSGRQEHTNFYDVLNNENNNPEHAQKSDLQKTTLEGSFEINSDSGAAAFESNNIKFTISGEKLKGGSFRITTENERCKNYKDEVPVRVHKAGSQGRHGQWSPTQRRCLSPFQARQMLHRNTYPLNKKSIKPDKNVELPPQRIVKERLENEKISPKEFVKYNQSNIEKIKSEVRANIITSPESYRRSLTPTDFGRCSTLVHESQTKIPSRDRITRCSLKNANEILQYENQITQQTYPVYNKKGKKVTFK